MGNAPLQQPCPACENFILIEGNGWYHTAECKARRGRLADERNREEAKLEKAKAEEDRQKAERIARDAARAKSEAARAKKLADEEAAAARKRAETLAANAHAKEHAKARAKVEAEARVHAKATQEMRQIRAQLHNAGVEVESSVASSLFEEDRALDEYDENGNLRPDGSGGGNR
jgi:hypothetical protein